MEYPLHPDYDFDPDQQNHFDAVTGRSKGWFYLAGGPGCGKTMTTSNIQLFIMERDSEEILSIYPTHAARLVGIQELIEASCGEADVMPYADDDKPGENADMVLTFRGGRIRFKTIHAALGIKLVAQPGRDSKFIQSYSDAIQAKMNFFRKYLFIDEVSMITAEMLTARMTNAEDKRAVKSGIADMLEKLIQRHPGFQPFVHMTGDFNQLAPPSKDGTFCKQLLSGPDIFDIKNTLKINHRSGRDGINFVINHILEHGKLPTKMDDLQGVYHLTDTSRYYDKYKAMVKSQGGKVLGLSYSNKVRMKHSDLAAEANKQEHQFFTGNMLTVAEGKGAKIWPTPVVGPPNQIYFYNSEKIKIVETSGLGAVPGTEWAGAVVVNAHKCVVERDLNGQQYPGAYGKGPQFYLVDFLGDKKVDCPKHAYLDAIKKSLNNYLAPLGKEKNLDSTIKRLGKTGFTLAGLLTLLHEESHFLGDMVTYMCHNLNKAHTVEGYLDNVSYAGPLVADLFCRVAGGTPNSLFNLLWANMYESVNFKVLTTRSENAMTCHSAQGAGREIVFLNTKDIRRADSDTRKRLLYVGVSRAKQEITILT